MAFSGLGDDCGVLNLAKADAHRSRVWPPVDSDASGWGFSAKRGGDGLYHAFANVRCRVAPRARYKKVNNANEICEPLV